ncbi:MAG: Zn-dependent hydrolase [Alphaproteobacteria bacterium]|nr:Zn-dependent hydrolase [Alphaproteobacteria bacterium]
MAIGELRIDGTRLLARIAELAAVGAIDGGGCARLALTDDDRRGRDLVVGWMRELGLELRIDAIGNVFAFTAGWQATPPVMTGSHIDTVRTGGRYDGNYGVLAGLEVVRTLQAAGIAPPRPLCVAFFTNEEGSRFQPDMLGSLVHVGGLPLDEAYAARAADGPRLGDELARIGYRGAEAPGFVTPHAFVELHIEQGPILDAEGVTIGAVEDLLGISWQEITVSGHSNHSGTTPIRLRRDAGYVAAATASFLHGLAHEMGGAQVCTVGRMELHPNYINVIPARAVFTADLRNTDEALLREAEARLATFLDAIAARTGTQVERRRLARFEPVVFDADVADLIERTARDLGRSVRRMTSGAGHDAQMMARICPTAMIFVPSVKGLSHNPAEHTEPADLVAGADVLLHTLLRLAARN